MQASLHPIDSGATEEAAVSYSAAALAIFAAFTTPPTTARKGLINTCVNSLTSAGVWAKLDALHMLAAADSQAAIVIGTTGSYNLTAINSPAFVADRGFTGNGSTSYLDSGFNPTIAGGNFVRDSACIFGHCVTNVNVAGTMIGNSGGSLLLNPRNTNAFFTRVNNTANNMTAASTDSIGFWSATRSGASASETFKNGVSVDTDTGASIAMQSSGYGCCAAAPTGPGRPPAAASAAISTRPSRRRSV